ncbi:fibronectin type III domain-containing protein [Thalassobellus suaedae]|uniref:fibronectin type III domain-containing protein n=1 Tax=Thalassobellus suaedae TaxID=3074124 RepID=UPI0039F4B901
MEPRRSFIINIDDFFRSTNPDWQNYVWLQAAIQNPISTWVDASGDTDYRVLTPAGQAYANTTSNKAYNPSVVYVPIWTPFKESLTYTISEDFQNIKLHWEGKNGELINKYIVQKKSGFTWTTIYDSSDYTVLSTTPQPIPAQTTEYRIIAVGLDNVQSSQSTFFTVQSVVAAPNDLVGIAVSAKKISLSWSEVTNAEYTYNIKRSTTPGGTYETVASYITGLNYVDSGLNPETNYYYKISSVNTGGESADSSPEAMVTTMALVAPSSVSNILVGSGDDQVKLKWDLIEDSQFHIKRSDSQSGTICYYSHNRF